MSYGLGFRQNSRGGLIMGKTTGPYVEQKGDNGGIMRVENGNSSK